MEQRADTESGQQRPPAGPGWRAPAFVVLVLALLLMLATFELGIDLNGTALRSGKADADGLLKLRPWSSAALQAVVRSCPTAPPPRECPSAHAPPPPRPPAPPALNFRGGDPAGYDLSLRAPGAGPYGADKGAPLPAVSDAESWFADGGDAGDAGTPTAAGWRRWGTALPGGANLDDGVGESAGELPPGAREINGPVEYTGPPHLSHLFYTYERLNISARADGFNHALARIMPWEWQAHGVSSRLDPTPIGRAFTELEYLGYEVFPAGKRYETMKHFCDETGYNVGAPTLENRLVREIPGAKSGATGLLAYQRVRVPRGLASHPPRFQLMLSEIHFLVSSTTPHFFQNVAFQMATWGRQVASFHAFSKDGHPSMGHPFYASGYAHDEPPSRNHLQAVALTAQMYRDGKLPGVKWVFIVDDDTYVFVDVLLEYLRHFNWREAVVLGAMGPHSGTVWFASGGNGYAFSIPAILLIGEAHSRGYCPYFGAVDMTIGTCGHLMHMKHVQASGIWPGPGGGRMYTKTDDLAQSGAMPLIGVHHAEGDASMSGYARGAYDLWVWWSLYGLCGAETGWEMSDKGRRPKAPPAPPPSPPAPPVPPPAPPAPPSPPEPPPPPPSDPPPPPDPQPE